MTTRQKKASITDLSALAGLRTGDKLPIAARRLIDDAFDFIRSAAHRAWAIKPRANPVVDELAFYLARQPAARARCSIVERRVIEAKFGPHLDNEISNTAAAARLGVIKQAVAYQLRNILENFRQIYGAISFEQIEEFKRERLAATVAGKSVLKGEAPEGLMNDAQWQQISRWRRALEKNHRLTAEDLSMIGELTTRLQKAGGQSTPDGRAARAASSAPGRGSPARYYELRQLFAEDPALLDRLTGRQREVMTIGLALEDPTIGADQLTDLGFRRFPENQAMTFQNFNYFFREVVKRLQVNL